METTKVTLYDNTVAERRILDNGLKLVTQVVKNGCAAICCAVKTGSNYDPQNLQGISHFAEHMVFRGTATRSGVEVVDTLDEHGARWNAATFDGHTECTITMPKKSLLPVADVLHDILFYSDFGPRKTQLEKNIILAEMRKSHDDADIMLEENLFKRLYSTHPIRNSAYGTKEGMDAITRDDLIAYHSAFYTPNNTVLAVVGDFNGDEVSALEELFSKPDKKELPAVQVYHEPFLNGKFVHEVPSDFEEVYVGIGMHLRKDAEFLNGSADNVAMNVFNTLLCDTGDDRPTSSRLYRRIREQKGLLYRINSKINTGPGYGHLIIDFPASKEENEKIIALVFEEIDKLGKEEVGSAELSKVKNFIISCDTLDNSNYDSRAESFAEMEAVKKDGLERTANFHERVSAVTSADIMRVAKEYLRPENHVIVKLLPNN